MSNFFLAVSIIVCVTMSVLFGLVMGDKTSPRMSHKNPYIRHNESSREKLSSCVARLNDLASYVGFVAKFELADGDTLLMSGELCDEGFLSMLPKIAYDDIIRSGFKSARCSGPNGSSFTEMIAAE